MADPTMAGATDPTATADPTAAPDSSTPDVSQGYCIEITVKPSGDSSAPTITISVEPLPEEAAEDGSDSGGDSGSSDDSDDSQSVPNAREAAKLVVDIINNAGQMQDSSAGQSDMSSGYGGQ